ncbi:hypothetical protein [Candidatus Deianiraea vastatrix]|uniref:Uncharacterized protein n=1 Tax=Candidatus Deianiraea vastatrix TaxID=2163644 RepID=A0A5B8XGC9_9RICK|nr:hypothetical protein [Candidatus Deianiraea vastatrix]QED23905.1 hypothetical protein Deia_01124 [Candidatus Deianiraea vastatrix]
MNQFQEQQQVKVEEVAALQNNQVQLSQEDQDKIAYIEININEYKESNKDKQSETERKQQKCDIDLGNLYIDIIQKGYGYLINVNQNNGRNNALNCQFAMMSAFTEICKLAGMTEQQIKKRSKKLHADTTSGSDAILRHAISLILLNNHKHRLRNKLHHTQKNMIKSFCEFLKKSDNIIQIEKVLKICNKVMKNMMFKKQLIANNSNSKSQLYYDAREIIQSHEIFRTKNLPSILENATFSEHGMHSIYKKITDGVITEEDIDAILNTTPQSNMHNSALLMVIALYATKYALNPIEEENQKSLIRTWKNLVQNVQIEIKS